MKKNILITWVSKWLWKFLLDNLKSDYNAFWVCRSEIPSLTPICKRGEEEEILPLLGEEQEKIFNIDLTKFELFDNLIKIFEQEQISFDVIILNAWVWAFWKFGEIEPEKYIEIINLNLLANILLLQRLEKYLNKNTKIIFIWSISSKKFLKYWAVYQASKFGLRWFAGALKNEWKDKKIFFLNPKILDTDFHSDTKIELNFEKEQYTDMKEVLQVIQNILAEKEKRFEIDL